MVGRKVKKIVVRDVKRPGQVRHSIKYGGHKDKIGIESQSVKGPHKVYLLPYRGKQVNFGEVFSGIEGIKQAEQYAHKMAVDHAHLKQREYSGPSGVRGPKIKNKTKRGRPQRQSSLENASL